MNIIEFYILNNKQDSVQVDFLKIPYNILKIPYNFVYYMESLNVFVVFFLCVKL